MEIESESSNKCQKKIQFTEDTFDSQHDSKIGVKYISDNRVDFHLGFLQVRHRYEIRCTFKCPKAIEGSLVERNTDPLIPNPNIRLIDLKRLDKSSESSDDIYDICIEYFAHKEKLLKEQISLQSSDSVSQTLSLVFNARVLGKGKGTPSIRKGIKQIAIEMDEDDDGEATDWTGFTN
ncbi:UPF0687 protein C20orf27 homolog isoform X2 [Oppia nitens]|uniref:UPF0687 protein C20orf27 homolog isoform X2 n=1 Tax=Oppia nitens TaxID=1686743 RepID=UPI0023DB1078|nr:UPF0687 protein C20orf27 homolog isoform X2 [Oppia nitens]